MCPKAEVLWSLDLPTDCAGRSEELAGISFPVDLTEIIDRKRPGPNKCGVLVVGALPEEVDVAFEVPTISGIHAELEEVGTEILLDCWSFDFRADGLLFRHRRRAPLLFYYPLDNVGSSYKNSRGFVL